MQAAQCVLYLKLHWLHTSQYFITLMALCIIVCSILRGTSLEIVFQPSLIQTHSSLKYLYGKQYEKVVNCIQIWYCMLQSSTSMRLYPMRFFVLGAN